MTDPGGLPTAKDNVPGFTGYRERWKPETCSLSAYAGQTVLLAFRTFNDPGTLGENPAVPPGRLGRRRQGRHHADQRRLEPRRLAVVPAGAAGHVADFTVTILSIDRAKGKITVKRLPLTGDFAVKNKANVQKYIDKNADFVGAIVFYDDPSETSTDYARYRLTVNGVTQPGGGM